MKKFVLAIISLVLLSWCSQVKTNCPTTATFPFSLGQTVWTVIDNKIMKWTIDQVTISNDNIYFMFLTKNVNYKERCSFMDDTCSPEKQQVFPMLKEELFSSQTWVINYLIQQLRDTSG